MPASSKNGSQLSHPRSCLLLVLPAKAPFVLHHFPFRVWSWGTKYFWYLQSTGPGSESLLIGSNVGMSVVQMKATRFDLTSRSRCRCSNVQTLSHMTRITEICFMLWVAVYFIIFIIIFFKQEMFKFCDNFR